MDVNEILAIWQRLRVDSAATGKTDEVPSVETNTVVSGGSARLAISEREYCSLLLPISVKELSGSIQVSQIVSVRTLTLGRQTKRVHFMEISCEDEQLNEVFARVVSDILRRIEQGISSQRSVDEALAEFRKLLEKRSKNVPDESTVIGLIGEMVTLIELMSIKSNGLRAWHGPDSDRHDFRAGPVAIEVKTSLGADGYRIHINGIRQLESESADCLLIRHIRIEPDPDGSLSLPFLVDQVKDLTTDHDDLDKKLNAVGYSDDQAETWGVRKYRSLGANAYEIKDGFPRLIPDSLNLSWPAPGLSSISYEVDLSVASEFKLSGDLWNTKLGELAQCL